jgi:hypothetical protein
MTAEDFEERAAIMEYLGNVPREEAERRARARTPEAQSGRTPPDDFSDDSDFR